MSPYLFNVYVDELSGNLNSQHKGCYVGDVCVNHLSYADDMVLMAPSIKALQALINTCASFASDNDILYNTSKTVCMTVWPKKLRYRPNPLFYLNGVQLESVHEFF